MNWIFSFRIESVGLESIFWVMSVTENWVVVDILEGQ